MSKALSMMTLFYEIGALFCFRFTLRIQRRASLSFSDIVVRNEKMESNRRMPCDIL